MKRMVVVVCVLLAAATSLQARGPPPSHPPPLPWTPERWSSAPPQQQNESMGGSTPPSSVEEEEHRGGGFEDLVTCCNLSPQQNHHPSFSNDTTNCALECSLEDSRGWCGWEGGQSKESFTWTRETWDQLGPRVRNMSPLLDHTTNSSAGHMLVVIMNGTSGNRVAELRSPCLHSAGPDCTVSFWYYRHGPFVGPMELWLSEDKSETLLWYEPYEQPGSWLHAQVWLGRRAGPFRVSLRKLELGRYVGATAVDDLALVGCALPPPRAECPSTEPPAFRCSRSGACVEACLRCDLTDHCGDGSDEEDCDWTQQCDFESGLCDWRQASDDEDDFDWTLQRGPSSTPLTGPYTDHTLGTGAGTYLYIEASEPQAFGDRAVLMSRAFGPVSESAGCALRLHYHMWGRNVYRLAVYRRSHRNGRGQLLWARYGNRGDRWVRGNVTLAATQPFQVLVEGVVGDDYHSDIAIDDLSFINCPLFDGELPLLVTPTNPVASSTLLPNDCTKGEFVCRSDAACLSPGALCNFREDCADGSDEAHCVLPLCGFTDGVMCFWTVLRDNVGGGGSSNEEDGFRWSLGQGATVYPMESDHRPTVDHTTGEAEGWYLYADSSSGKFWEASDLVTPTIGRSGPNCHLVFWYHMEGVSIGLLQVLVSSMNVTYPLWMKNGDQGAGWRQARVLLGVRVRFQVIVRVRKGVGYLGDLAIDDLEFSDCAPPEPGTELCSASDFPCHNGLCVPAFSLCDFNNDCIDNSDEAPQICDHCRRDQRPCATGGQCVHEEQLCDFRADCEDGSDESECGSACTFEQGDTCGWENSQSDCFNWVLGRGSPHGPRPPVDHTLGSEQGHFFFLEPTQSGRQGDKGHLKSGEFHQSSRLCTLSFWYYVSSATSGSLRIIVKTEYNLIEMWRSQPGEQVGVWRQALVPLKRLRNFVVILEGVRTHNYAGGTAIDDIDFLHCSPEDGAGSCLLSTDFHCANGQCVEPRITCDYKDDCGDNSDEVDCVSVAGSCDFNERGDEERNDVWCGWRNREEHNDFTWVLEPRGVSHGTGPTEDHTPNLSGGFLRVDTAGRSVGQRAGLVAPSIFPASFGLCRLRFWFFMSGSGHKAALRVYSQGESGAPILMFVARGDMGTQWKYANIEVSHSVPFRVVFEAEAGSEQPGSIALDDVSFTPSCNLTGAMCPENWYWCGEHQRMCLPSELVCDGREDCPGGSDEEHCPTPSLDTGCPPSTFLCGNGSCTPAAPLCYDPADCLVGQGDASDCWCWDVDCRNEGVCVLNGTTGICRCAHGWQGEHCLLPTPDAAHPSARPSRQNPAYSIEVWAAVVIAAALLLPLVLLAAFIQQRRRLQALSELDDDSFPIIKTDAWPKSDLTKLARSRRHGTQPSSFCNPLYRRHSDPTVGTAPVGLPATSRGRPDRYAQLCTLRQVGWPHGESHL
ncbi:MAM and LDL-receptor class A domain-containing protein 1 isoform X2 [Petromyzon marinus]|uniref:MAM and LDL-receptor class A domain-containing protein 1 isoform X2 n=1 Tax=Petromyzon marinus TaxID=7757 RepID=UPI003F71856F